MKPVELDIICSHCGASKTIVHFSSGESATLSEFELESKLREITYGDELIDTEQLRGVIEDILTQLINNKDVLQRKYGASNWMFALASVYRLKGAIAGDGIKIVRNYF